MDALQYIYDMISTSDYDVRQAIEYFDKSQQRALEEMRLQEQQQANALAMEQNDLLDRQNSIAEKARRDANIAAAVGAVQRHNTNKTIKSGWRRSSGGRYITCRRMRFIGAGRSLSRARFPKALFQRPRLYGAFRTGAS